MTEQFLLLHPDDNVLVALTDLSVGTAVEFSGQNFSLVGNTEAKHKFTMSDLAVVEGIVM